jgi:hypothetical protein
MYVTNVFTKCTSNQFTYELLQINVPISGDYGFSNISPLKSHVFLYRDTFDHLDPSVNLFAGDRNGCGSGIIWMRYYLQANITYILVMADSAVLVSKGFANVSVNPLSKSICPREMSETFLSA